MTVINKIELYDFAKNVLGGKEPESAIFLSGDRQTIKQRVDFYGNPDAIPSVRFSPTDSLTFLPKLDTHNGSYTTMKLGSFPGIT